MEIVKDPLVSIIMPFYNCEKYIAEAIESILNQTFSDFECILINDASPDNSDEVIKPYLNDQRIVYIKNEKRLGIVENLNKGLGMARGAYIARMDGDDISYRDRLEKQLKIFQNREDVDIVGTFAQIIDSNGVATGRNIVKPIEPNGIREGLLVFLTIIHGTAMIKKEVYNKIGGYRKEYLYSEDVDFTYRCIFSGMRGVNVPEFLYKYRYHNASTAHDSKINALRAYSLRKETIKMFNIKPTLKQWLLIYAQLFVGCVFSGRQRQLIERMYKRLFYAE